MKEVIRIVERYTSDVSQSHNGGDYTYGYDLIWDGIRCVYTKSYWCDSDFYTCPVCGNMGGCECDIEYGDYTKYNCHCVEDILSKYSFSHVNRMGMRVYS